ncbi:MAG: hypothetical protein AAGA23_13445 [Pseudomonadota bacterium]
MGFYRRTRLDWRDWNPGLDNDDRDLGDCLDSLPGATASAIPLLVRLFENPASPLALPGAITLERHDALHVLLGRGLMAQDEAFVIGFTMGSDTRVRPRHHRLFRWLATRLYRKPYRLKPHHLLAFDLGFGFGQEQHCRNFHDFPFEERKDATLGELRAELGLNIHRLHALFNHEKVLIPASEASKRLDLDWKGTDPSAIWRRE